MAQQAALRVHADRRGRRTVVYHPMSHLERHEDQALRAAARAGRAPRRRPAPAAAARRPRRRRRAARRRCSSSCRSATSAGSCPPWDDLAAQVGWARERGAAAHLDGARLWEATAGYERSPAEIAGLFDTAYVSFYKGIGALPGCCLAGPEDVVAEVREWRRRMGGTLFGLWPGAASALSCLRRRLPLMPAYLGRAREIADARARPARGHRRPRSAADADAAPAAAHEPGRAPRGGAGARRGRAVDLGAVR